MMPTTRSSAALITNNPTNLLNAINYITSLKISSEEPTRVKNAGKDAIRLLKPTTLSTATTFLAWVNAMEEAVEALLS